MQKPEFIPRPGQVDYTNIRRAPVLNCAVRHNGKILLVQRSEQMHFYPGKWNWIAGYLDDGGSVVEKVKEELREELGIQEEDILNIFEGEVFEQEEPEYNKIWIVHPVLIDVKNNRITLDWEAEKFEWINIEDVYKYDLLPGFEKVLKSLKLA